MTEYYDHNAEQALIGCALMDPGTLELIDARPEVFSMGLARVAWETMLRQREEGIPIDPLTVADAADKAKAELPTFLGGILATTFTADNAEHYAEIVRRHHLTREVLRVTAEVQDAARKGSEGKDLLSTALEQIAGLDRGQETGGHPIGELVRVRYRELSRLMDANAADETLVTGYPTGVPILDGILGGLQPGVATLVAGRPGMGKTSFGRKVADANSARGHGVHVFSLEDTRSAYLDRLIGDHAEIAIERLRAGKVVNRDEMGKVRNAADVLTKRKRWLLDDRSGLDAREIVRSVRRARKDNQTSIVLVDYIQLVKRRQGTRPHEGISENIHLLADAAKQDELAYVVMSQLNRHCEMRDDKKPRLGDLRECGALEERSKAVIGLYRPVLHDRNAKEDLIELHVLKNTNGRTGYCDAHWDGPTTRIY